MRTGSVPSARIVLDTPEESRYVPAGSVVAFRWLFPRTEETAGADAAPAVFLFPEAGAPLRGGYPGKEGGVEVAQQGHGEVVQ